MTRVLALTILAIILLFILAPWVITEILPQILPDDW